MLFEKNLKIIVILLFLSALNLFNQSSLLLFMAFILLLIKERGRVHIESNDNTLYIMICFAITFFTFATQNGLIAGISAFGCPMAYYLGLRIQSKGKDNIVQLELKSKVLILIIVSGMSCHALVNFFYEFIRFGVTNSGAIHYDFFSFGAQTSATGAATYLTLFAGIIFYMLVTDKSIAQWIVRIVLIIMAFAYDMILGGRTFFALAGMAFFASMVMFIFGQKNINHRMKAWRKVICLVTIISCTFMFVYIFNHDKVIKFYESTYLFHRISYAYVSQSQDFFSFFQSSDRGDIRNQYIDLMFDYPFGGRKILSIVGLFAHELWLDIYDSAGFIPFILIWIITIKTTLCNLKYIMKNNISIQNRVILTGITVSVTLQFFFEPVLTGCRTLLFSYFFICGVIRSNLLQHY